MKLFIQSAPVLPVLMKIYRYTRLSQLAASPSSTHYLDQQWTSVELPNYKQGIMFSLSKVQYRI
jgi:hypothetical protein